MAPRRLRDRIPRRAILCVLMFLACLFSYVIRTNQSIIIVAMVEQSHSAPSKSRSQDNASLITTSLECSRDDSGRKKNDDDKGLADYGPRYPWSQHIVEAILAAYFYGTLPSSIPGGILAEKFGGARIVGFATLIPAVLNLLMPLAAEIHFSLLIVLRFAMGFFGSAVYPALNAMIARWAPPSEKGVFTWTLQGGPFGAFVTLAVCGAVIDAIGWKAAYYITSGAMLIFYLFWIWLAYDTPDVHPTITTEERNYIREQIGSSVTKKKNPLPVKQVAKSVPFIVLLYAHFANMWGIYFLSTNGPKYTLEVLGFDMKSGGAITGLPYIARLGAGIAFAASGDYFRRNGLLTLAAIRRSYMIFSHVMPGLCLLLVTYSGCNGLIAMAMMTLALAFNGATCQTSMQNHQDLAPNFAGTLYGVMNTIGSLSGVLIPPIIGALTNEHNGIEEWRPIFWLSAGIFLTSTLLFWIFGSVQMQPWNDLSQAREKERTGIRMSLTADARTKSDY